MWFIAAFEDGKPTDQDTSGHDFAREGGTTLAMFDCSISIIDAKALASIDRGGGAREPKEKWDAADNVNEWPDLAARKAARGSGKPFDPGPRYQSWGSFTMTTKGLEVEKTEGRGEARKMVRARVSGPFEILGKSRNPKGGDWGL